MNLLSLWFLSLISVNLSARNLPPDREELLKKIEKEHKLSAEQLQAVREVFEKNKRTGQGNPKVTKHAATRAECREKTAKHFADSQKKIFEQVCGRPNMAPLYESKAKEGPATTCIDQFEFPNIHCEYPVVWVKAKEAAEICSAMGKRLCDAHEWEGACAGQLKPPDYAFDKVKGLKGPDAFRKLRKLHNPKQSKQWAYGKKYRKGMCAANSFKHKKCNGGNWKECGSNTYPSGMFPACASRLKVYDLHGNAAEHMNLPTRASEMTSAGGLGYTEMKGSWFIWDKFQAHADHCRWRAPYWHGTKVADVRSHENYHLGFRCCQTVAARKVTKETPKKSQPSKDSKVDKDQSESKTK